MTRMRSKHTPGKWEHCDLSLAVDHSTTLVIECDGEEIIEVNGIGSNRERNANAELVVASPRMYETLCRVYEHLTRLNDTSPHQTAIDDISQVLLSIEE